jgi:hypothetical protein
MRVVGCRENIKQCFQELLYKTDIDVNLFWISSHFILFSQSNPWSKKIRNLQTPTFFSVRSNIRWSKVESTNVIYRFKNVHGN